MSSTSSLRADVLVIGSGPGGYVASIRLGQLGKKVIMVEKHKIGGVCVNTGCVPSKALITASKLVKNARNASNMGIDAEIKIDLQRLQDWKQSVVDRLVNGIAQLCKLNNVQLIHGDARFVSRNKAEVKISPNVVTFVEFENAIIATGSSQIELPSISIDGKRVLSSTEALSLNEVPRKIIVVGGGIIGLEIGMAYANLFGTELTIVELLDQLLSGVDAELVTYVARSLHKLKAEIHLTSKVKTTRVSEAGVEVLIETPEGELTKNADYLLLAIGRKPNTKNLGLEMLGVQVDQKGFIKVDERQRTNVGNIYAIGDVVGGPLLAHKASKQGVVAAEVIAGMDSTFSSLAIPSAIFTDPEIAFVGLNPAEVTEKRIQVVVGKFPFLANAKALASSESVGFVKIIAEKDSKRILGVEIVGNESSDLVSEATLAIELETTLEKIASTVHPHPTLPEAMMEAAENALGKAIHIQNRRREN